MIKVVTDAGTDYAFLAAEKTKAAAGEVSFAGTSGAVHQGKALIRLILGAAGSVKAGGNALEAKFAVELSIAGKGMTLTLPPQCLGGEVIVTANGKTVRVPVEEGASTLPVAL